MNLIMPETVSLTEADLALQRFRGYEESDLDIFEAFINPDAKAEAGFIVDFLGVRTRTTSLWPEARAGDGQLLGVPVPGDFHAEAIEWLGVLKAVRDAGERFTAMELGAGFGPWIVGSAAAARRRGVRDFRLYAVEGDPRHFRDMRQHFIDNGFDPDQHNLFEAAIGARAGTARWPVVEDSTGDWGFRPISDRKEAGALAIGDYMARTFERTKPVKVFALRDLLRREPMFDLIHMDVQGHEVDIARSCLDDLNRRVRRMVVGTHSRKLDGDLLELMCRAGWVLEHEKPTKFTFWPNPVTLEAMTTADGTQVWRNPRLV